MKQKLWPSLTTCLAYCIDKELHKAIDYLKEHVRVLIEHQEKENKRTLLIRSPWDVLTACDFFTVELLVGRKLVRCTVFFVMELATRKVFFAPVKLQPDGKYMRQVVRILTDGEDGFLYGKRYLIHDRDPLYGTKGFHATLRSSGIEPVKPPARSPDLNCHAERLVKSIKSECLDHLILSSVKHLEYVIEQYCAYYHHERIHQSLNRIIEPKHAIDDLADIVCIERLGGLLKSYHRLAA